MLRLQRDAGNAAVSQMLTMAGPPSAMVQRDGDPTAATPDAAGPDAAAAAPPPPPAVLTINADELPADAAAGGGATPAPTTAGTDSASTDAGAATPAATGPAPGATSPIQYQLQWNYTGGTQWPLAGGPRTASPLQEQLALNVNIAHHATGRSGFESTFSAQGTMDPSTGEVTGLGLQINEALVWQATDKLQISLNANASGGGTQTPTGPGLTGAAAFGPQVAVNLTDNTQVFVMAQAGVSLTENAPATGSVSGGAGIVVSF